MIFFLILYFLFLIGFMIFSIAGLYHLWKYGYRGDRTKIVMATYLIVVASIIFISLMVIGVLDWGIGFQFDIEIFDRFLRR